MNQQSNGQACSLIETPPTFIQYHKHSPTEFSIMRRYILKVPAPAGSSRLQDEDSSVDFALKVQPVSGIFQQATEKIWLWIGAILVHDPVKY